MTALSLHGVDKHYGSTHAVRAVHLDVSPGEVLVVVGPSGCGKSTLLRLVAGLEAPDAGSVAVGGELVADERTFRQPEHRRVGLVPQDHALFPHLSVARNVAFGLDRLPRQARTARVTGLLELLRIEHLADRYPHELSGGEQQRVALARALAPRPAVVLLDEPFSSLDEGLRARVRTDTLEALQETGSAAVLVTHDQVEALSLGDRVAVLRAGVLEQVGTPEEVYEAPATRFVAAFMGDADFLPAQVATDGLRCELGLLLGGSGLDGSATLEVVLRPHQVSLAADPRSAARVERVEYHGAYALHEVRLESGRTIRSWCPGVRHDVGAAVSVGLVEGATPVVLADGVGVRRSPLVQRSVQL
jgi:iron(III) transport system ATP-binding protein